MLLDRASRSQTFDFGTVRAMTVAGEPTLLVLLSPDAASRLAALSPSLSISKQITYSSFFAKTTTLASQPGCENDTAIINDNKRRSSDATSKVSAAGLITSFLTGEIYDLTEKEIHRQSCDSETVCRSSSSVLGKYEDDMRLETRGCRVASPWIVGRYRVDAHCLVSEPVLSSEASYRSFLPEPWDVGIGFGARMDEVFISPIRSFRFPGYSQTRREMCSQIGYSRWSTASRLARATPPGGTIGLDDKLFCIPSATSSDHCCIARYRYGSAVHDFEDARAESRCLLEGQVLSFRSALESAGHEMCLATRIFCWGRAVENRALAATVCEVLGADFVVSHADHEAGKLDDQYSILPQYHPYLRQMGTTTLAAQPDIDCVDTRVRRASIGAAYWAYFTLMQHHCCSSSLDFNTTIRAGLEPDYQSSAHGSRSSSNSSHHTSISREPTSLSPDDQIHSSFLCDTCPSVWLASRGRTQGAGAMQRPSTRTTVAMRQRMDEQSRGLVRLACADHDMFAFYGALLPEFNRLWSAHR